MPLSRFPRRVLITTDAVGGVWRYSLDLARGLRPFGVEAVLLGFGPPPDHGQRREAENAAELRWSALPLDWMAGREADLAAVPEAITAAARGAGADVIQVNLPSQAAKLHVDMPVVAVSHSCVVSWFRAVSGADPPEHWQWQRRLNAWGFARSDAVVAPSRSHAELLARCYPDLGRIEVVANAAGPAPRTQSRQPFAYAAARWWDAGKNAGVLDFAAAGASWPVLALGASEGPDGQRHVFRHAQACGQRGHAELRAIAARAAAFVSPSIYEPFGLAALEAAQAGAALVLSDIPTYRELWNGAALFADPVDPAAFAAALNRLADDRDLRLRLGRLAANRAASFSLERQARTMMALYRTAAAAPQRKSEAV